MLRGRNGHFLKKRETSPNGVEVKFIYLLSGMGEGWYMDEDERRITYPSKGQSRTQQKQPEEARKLAMTEARR